MIGKKMTRHRQNRKSLRRRKLGMRRRVRQPLLTVELETKIKKPKKYFSNWRIRLRKISRISTIQTILLSATFGCTSCTPSSATRPLTQFLKRVLPLDIWCTNCFRLGCASRSIILCGRISGSRLLLPSTKATSSTSFRPFSCREWSCILSLFSSSSS